MLSINTQDNGTLEVITVDSFTGEGTDDLRLVINSIHCSAWIHLNDDEARKLRDELNEWLEE